jgi:HTH-type transcriptional regulator/antitoxin HigA
MIANERQYEVARRKLTQLRDALMEAENRPDAESTSVLRQAGINGIRLLMEELEAELAEYEQLRAGQAPPVALPSLLEDLPATLVRARIARGWSQSELARALGVREQQVQKDERGGYARASLARLRRVADVLGVRISGEARLPAREPSGSTSISA